MEYRRHKPCGALIHVALLQQHAEECSGRSVEVDVEVIDVGEEEEEEEDGEEDDDPEDGDNGGDEIDISTHSIRRLGESLLDVADGADIISDGLIRSASEAVGVLQRGLEKTAAETAERLYRRRKGR